MPTRNVPLADAGPRVEDVMLRGPRTYAPGTTVAEARAEFENPRVRLLLVARGDTFLGAVTRETIGDELAGDLTLDGLATAAPGALVAPADPVDRAGELRDARQTDRLPVVADDGTLVGLVCFNRRHGHFCVDA
jgi:CBS domain-containing protein